MASPVGGLRAVRALRSTRSNDKNPDNIIFSPLETLPTTTSSKALRTSATVFFVAPLSATIASTNSALFTGRLLTLIETELGVPSNHRQFYRKNRHFCGYRPKNWPCSWRAFRKSPVQWGVLPGHSIGNYLLAPKPAENGLNTDYWARSSSLLRP